jgi:glycosyltransferase involved in cell wall biosynthesis
MKFLWISRDVPLQPAAGDQAYSNGLIRSFVGAGAHGVLVAHGNPGGPATSVPGLDVIAIPRARRADPLSLLTPLPADACRNISKAFIAAISAALKPDIDVVFVDYYAMGWVLPSVRKIIASWPSRPVLAYISHNYEQIVRPEAAQTAPPGPMRLIRGFDAAKGARLERQIASHVDLITANTDEDRLHFQRLAPLTRVITLVPAYSGRSICDRPITAESPRRAVISGSSDWIAKRDHLKKFIREAEAPFRSAGIELLLVGRLQPKLREEIREISTVTRPVGWVDDLGAEIAKARIGIMPDETGGGFKHKYMDYIFGGAVVAAISSQIQGLPGTPRDYVIAEPDQPSLVAAVVRAMDDIPRLEQMRQAALSACADAFNWADRGEKLMRTLDELRSETPANGANDRLTSV